METGLVEIYLHHSYFRGRLTGVECLGHTNNTGGNGAGKTTLLSLIPVFYGLEPSKVVDRAAGKLSFVNHYLRTKKSMIVFEYKKAGDTKCVILYRSKDAIAYRFIDAPASVALFSQVMLRALNDYDNAKEWLRECVSREYDVSKQLSTSIDYRSIIQNDKQRLRTRRKAEGSLIQLAHQYSLCSSDSQMRHIESLSSVLMRHDKLLAQFKLMVVDSFLTDQIEIGQAPYHKEDMEYVSSIETLIELEKHKDKFSESIAQYEGLKESWGYLLSYQNKLKKELASNVNSLEEQSFKRKQLKTEKSEFVRKSQEHLSRLNTAFGAHFNKAETKKSLIDSIYDAREKWDAEVDIVSKIAEYEGLRSLEDKAEKDVKHFKAILESAHSEKQSYDTEVSKHEMEASREELALTQKISQLQESLHQFELEMQQKELLKSEQASQEQHAFKEKRNIQSKALLETVHRLRVEQQKASNYSPEEHAALDSLKNKIAELNRFLINDLYTQQKDAQEQLDNKKQEREALLVQRKQKNNELDTKRNKRIEITHRLTPEDGTVRSFLNHNLKNWRSTIGKVIRPELLTLKTLSPVIGDASDHHCFYGVLIDLENILLPEEALSDEILSQQREEITREIENLVTDIKEIDKKILVLNNVVNTIGLGIGKLLRDEQRYKDDIAKFELQEKSKMRAIDNDVSSRLRVLDNKIAKAVEVQQQFDNATKQCELEIRNKYQEELIAFKANASATHSQMVETISAKEYAITVIKNDLKQRLIELKDAFNCVLKDKDIDPKTVQGARQRKEESEAKYTEVKAFSHIISDYKTWESSTWRKVESYESELALLNKSISQIEQEITTATENSARTIDEKNRVLNELDRAIEKLEMTISAIHSALEDIRLHSQLIPVGHQPAQLDDSIPLEVMIQSAKEAVTSIKTLRWKISSAVKKVGEILLATGKSNNKVLHIWRSMEEQRIAISEHDKFSEDLYIESVVDVRVLIEESIPDIKAVILESIKTVGARYIRFYQALTGLKKKVRNVSAKLVKEINTSNNFDALDDIKIELVSKIDEFDLWSELTAFNSVWERWGELGTDSLPEKDFVTTFSSVISELKDSRISSSIESLVDIDISMTENGRLVNIRTDADLKSISSTGISKLAVIVVFCGMTRYLCKDHNITIHWPLDELGELSDENVMLLFDFMDQNNISLFCAQPNPSVVLLRYFTSKNYVDKNLGIKKYVSRKTNKQNPLIAQTTAQVVRSDANG
ncbi:ATP-binding protein [Pseudoalteromonas sp. SA25]|uniref:ATP-binding protein n=1 Tax=Pseudoalteromonas sp. SA25 TaxID=2686347 RepID=UPI0013FE2FDB|nr:ATP-binding protein [Pseudoalteromonas sp. SA25]